MKRKIFVVAATLSLICMTGVLAQEPAAKPTTPPTPPTAEEMAQQQTDRVTQRLNLTDAQAKQIHDLNLKQAKEQQALHEKMKAMRQERAEKMKSILTTEQFVQWSQMQGKGRMQGMQGRHPGRRADMKECPDGCPKAPADKGDDGRLHKRRARQ